MQTSYFTPYLLFIALFFSTQVVTAHGNGQGIPGNTNNAKALTGVLDSTLVWNWGTTSYDQLVSGSFNTYASNNLTNTLNRLYSGGAWINSTQDNYTYDGSNNLISDTNQHWTGTAWKNYELYISTYDGSHNELTYLTQLWTSGAWVNTSQVINHYSGNLLISNILQTWSSNAWVTTDSFTYAYDGNNNLLTELDLNLSGGVWTNSTKYTYTYSNNKPVTYTIATWTGASWSNESEDTYTYGTGAGLLATDINQVYGPNGAYNNQKLIYGYDANNNNTSIINQDYPAGAWVNFDSTHLYYHETGSANAVVNVNELDGAISVYPNPAQSVINVAVSNARVQPLIATLYDITGRTLKTIPVNSSVTQIGLNNVSAGIYQLVLADEKGNKAVKQIVVQ